MADSTEWREELNQFFRAQGEQRRPLVGELMQQRNQEVGAFIKEVTLPAFEEVRAALEQYGRVVLLRDGGCEAAVRVRKEGQQPVAPDELEYILKARVTPERAYPYAVLMTHRAWLPHHEEVALREGPQDYGVADISKEEVIRHVLAAFKHKERENGERV